MPQKFLNNFDTQFIAAVKDVPTSGTPATELDYGIVRVTSGAAAALGTLAGGDHYILTAYKKSGTVVTNMEIMKVTVIDTSVINETRLTVLRAQEGTTAQQYVPGDYISCYFTKAGAENFVQEGDPRLSDGRAPSGAAGGVLSGTYPNPGFAVDMATQAELDAVASAKQDVLVSGTSIKTINGASVLGSGNIAVETAIAAGTTAQYWRGDKTWQTLDKTAVGLANVENTALSTWAGSSNLTTVGTIANALYRHRPAAGVNLFAEDGGGFYSDYTVQDNGSTYIPRKIGGSTVTLQSGTTDRVIADSTGATLIGAVYTNGSVRSNIVDLSSGTNFDLSLGNYFIRTVNGNVTFTVSNVPASRAYAFTVEIVHTSGTITWFSGVQWPNNNTAPTLTTGKTHLITFVTDNGGTTWRGVPNVNYNS